MADYDKGVVVRGSGGCLSAVDGEGVLVNEGGVVSYKSPSELLSIEGSGIVVKGGTGSLSATAVSPGFLIGGSSSDISFAEPDMGTAQDMTAAKVLTVDATGKPSGYAEFPKPSSGTGTYVLAFRDGVLLWLQVAQCSAQQ